jgi:hypothetical protein
VVSKIAQTQAKLDDLAAEPFKRKRPRGPITAREAAGSKPLRGPSNCEGAAR